MIKATIVILIIVTGTGYGSSGRFIHTIEFDNMHACLFAHEQIEMYRRVDAFCVPKYLEDPLKGDTR